MHNPAYLLLLVSSILHRGTTNIAMTNHTNFTVGSHVHSEVKMRGVMFTRNKGGFTMQCEPVT